VRSVSQADELQSRTDAFADLSLKFIEGLPNTDRVRRLAGQYQNASTSAAANYRAARRARSHAEFTAKMGIVSEGADESVFWLKPNVERQHPKHDLAPRTAPRRSRRTRADLWCIPQNGEALSETEGSGAEQPMIR
jgi:four helix bundle protein